MISYAKKHLFINNIPIKITLTPASNAFALMGEWRVVIEEALLWVYLVDLSPEIFADFAEEESAKRYSEIFVCKIRSFVSKHLRRIYNSATYKPLSELIPTQLVVAFVDTESLNGHQKQNPFNFQHKILNSST